ncbi:MAG: DUF3108 domain-containing protein [Myxococcaceae bacterium]|nr:DUF3108 domain-containing protein [Myxococcaceae bacterium]
MSHTETSAPVSLRLARALLSTGVLLATNLALAATTDAPAMTNVAVPPADASAIAQALPVKDEIRAVTAADKQPDTAAMSDEQSQLPFAPAERFFFEVSYLGLPVGTIQASVAAETALDGVATWPLIATATTNPAFILYPVKDRYISWFDPRTRLSLGNELIANENRVTRRERVRFDREEHKALVRREGGEKPRSEKTHELPLSAQDLLATFYATRTHPLEVGDVVESPIFTGNRTFTMRASVVGKERLRTKAGTFDTKRVHVEVAFSGKLQSKREVRIFFTDDARHIPVRIDAEFFIGTLAADLASFETGL